MSGSTLINSVPPLQPHSLSSQSPTTPHSFEHEIELAFAHRLFTGLDLRKVDRSKPNLWYLTATAEDRLLVSLRALKHAGFSTLGDFLYTLFQDAGYNMHPTVYMTISSFLNRTSKSGTHPIDIIRLIFSHPKSCNERAAIPSFPSRPRYALPPSLRTQKSLPAVLSPSTRNDVLDFALSETAKIVDNEARRLTTSTTPLACPKTLDWSHLHNFDLTANEELLSEEAPGLFTILSTIAVSPDARQRLESHTTQPNNTAASATDDGLDPDLHSSDTGQCDEGVADSDGRRNPWLVSVNTHILSGSRLTSCYI